MRITIFDVAHGSCAYVVADNGNTMLIDCADSSETGFSPAQYLVASACSDIHRFFPLNYDEDHLRGLPELRRLAYRIPIHILHRNPSIEPAQLRALKRQTSPLGPGITALLEMLETYTGTVISEPQYPSLDYRVFWNNYPDFTDTNNLSQVLFLHFDGTSIVFPGDMEKTGWRKLLENPAFRMELAKVKIFVASHHGRESGYCPEVFDICTPEIVIISDEAIQYETQEHAYGDHAKGIRWNGTDIRRVLTTRKDGTLVITKEVGQPGSFIQASK